VVSQTAANKRQTSISEISFDTVPDSTSFVGQGEIDLLGDVNVGTIPGVVLYQNHDGNGGALELYDEGGFFRSAYLVPTESGAGNLRVNGPSGAAWINGEHPLHGDEASLGVFGTSDFYVWAGETGDDSVVMPVDAVSASETKDEPGVATVYSTDMYTPIPDQWATLLSASVGRTDGYIFATGYLDVRINNSLPNQSYSCGLSVGSTASFARKVSLAPMQGSVESWQVFPLTLTGVFSQVEHVNLVCISGGTFDHVRVGTRHLEVMWFPTAYGTVSVPED
jgi:hypothetical protein